MSSLVKLPKLITASLKGSSTRGFAGAWDWSLIGGDGNDDAAIAAEVVARSPSERTGFATHVRRAAMGAASVALVGWCTRGDDDVVVHTKHVELAQPPPHGHRILVHETVPLLGPPPPLFFSSHNGKPTRVNYFSALLGYS